MILLIRFVVIVIIAVTFPTAGLFAEVFEKKTLEPGIIWSMTCAVQGELCILRSLQSIQGTKFSGKGLNLARSL